MRGLEVQVLRRELSTEVASGTAGSNYEGYINFTDPSPPVQRMVKGNDPGLPPAAIAAAGANSPNPRPCGYQFLALEAAVPASSTLLRERIPMRSPAIRPPDHYLQEVLSVAPPYWWLGIQHADDSFNAGQVHWTRVPRGHWPADRGTAVSRIHVDWKAMV